MNLNTLIHMICSVDKRFFEIGHLNFETGEHSLREAQQQMLDIRRVKNASIRQMTI